MVKYGAGKNSLFNLCRRILCRYFLYAFLSELLEQLAVGKTTLYARIKQGTFPPPVKFGERVSA